MASDQIVVINQLASRLENATSVERVYALQELQGHAKQVPEVVGSLSLKKVMDFLQEQGSAEEYQEALDLVYRLVKCRDKAASKSNTDIILADVNAVELLLDLLNHEDLTVGVMTSQILTELHANSGANLELQIQQCPDGMNKLLQRLPDSAREEVRNQAIVLIQQLTSTNEEMKKTVVFNEGFEILFGIIQREGGFQDAGLVIQDCLHICKNILSDSETCQRLFYAMGSDWILRLADFFDPNLLESIEKSSFSMGMEDDEDGDSGPSADCWFDDPSRLACAVLALASLYHSLSTPNKKHQNALATGTSVVVPSAVFWIARRGPSELVSAGLSLLSRLVEAGNADVGNLLANTYVKVSPSVPRKNIPSDIELPSLSFGWKPLPNDDRKFISVLSLLAERYIYPASAWNPRDGAVLGDALEVNHFVSVGAAVASDDSLAQRALCVLESILASDPSISDLIVQYILAPPPPPQVDGMYQDEYAQSLNPHASQLETMKPLGLLVLRLLVDGCNKILDGAVGTSKQGLDTAERAANVLSVIFIHGSQLAKELCTAVTTSHTGGLTGTSHSTGGNKFILPMLLFTAGRTARSAGGAGYPLLISILRMLACIASGCEFAAKQMLEDPANLFVLDLATAASESAGVPPLVQVAACLFLGCCFESLPAAATTPPPSSNGSFGGEDSILNRKSFLGMIDSRIGLNRFTDILKKPLAAKSNKDVGANHAALFISPDFLAFYQKQVEAIRAGIFEFYTGGASTAVGDAMQQQVIDMQKEKIAELEHKLSQHGGHTAEHVHSAQDTAATAQAAVAAATTELLTKFNEEMATLESTLATTRGELSTAQETVAQSAFSHQQVAQELQAALAKYAEAEATAQALLLRAQTAETAHLQLSENLTAAEAKITEKLDEVTALKQSVLQEHQEKKQLKETLDQRERKIELLVGELKATQPADGLAERKISDLENRNAELKQQLWEVEAELKKALEHPAQIAAPDVMTDVSLSSTPVPSGREDVYFRSISEGVVALVRTLGLADEVIDFPSIEATIFDSTADKSERGRAVDELLSRCFDAVSDAVGQCSDIAEGAGIHDLDGGEGSIVRVLDCCRKLAESLLDASERMADEAQVDQLKLQIDLLEQQLGDAERSAYDISDELRNAEDLLQQASTDLSATQQKLDASTAEIVRLHEQLQSAGQESSSVSALSTELEEERHKSAELQESLNEQVVSLHAALETARVQAAHDSQERADLLVELEGIKKASNQSTEEIRSELEKVRHELLLAQHQVTDQAAQFGAEMASMLAHHEQASKTLSDALVHDKEQLVSTMEQAHAASKESLEQRLNGAFAELATVRDDFQSQMAQTKSDHAAELSGAMEARAALEEQLLALRAVVSSDQNEAGDLRAQLDALRVTADAASSKCSALEQQIADMLSASAATESQLSDRITQHEDEEIHLKAAANQYQQLAEERAAELQEMRQETEKEFTQQDQKYAELLQQMEKVTAHTVSQKAQLKAMQATVNDKSAAEEAMRAELAAVQQELEAERATTAQLRATYEASASSSDALQSQEQELRRLTQSVDHLAREVNSKEAQIQSLSAQLRRRDGEFAGVLTTFESVKADVQQMREENERLSDKYLAENKIVKEKEREIRSLQSTLQVESAQREVLRSKHSEKNVSPSELILLTQNSDSLKKIESSLKELVAWLIATYKITDYKVTTVNHADGSKSHTISTAISVNIIAEPLRLLEVLRNCITWLVEARDVEVRDKSKALDAKDQEVASLKRILLAFESSDNAHAERMLLTPVRGGHSGTHSGPHAAHPAGVTVAEASSPPTQKGGLFGSSYNNAVVPMTPSASTAHGVEASSAVRWSGAKTALLQASPAAKQAAKLHSEVLKERSKLAALQEQHSDLLGLLAQQDVELSVFRETIQNKLGPNELMSVEEQARMSVEQYADLEAVTGPIDRTQKIYVGGSCSRCGRHFALADRVQSAVDKGHHTSAFMASVIQGKFGHFVTLNVDGDDSHSVNCLCCGAQADGAYAMLTYTCAGVEWAV